MVCGVQGVECRVWSAGCGVQGVECRVWDDGLAFDDLLVDDVKGHRLGLEHAATPASPLPIAHCHAARHQSEHHSQHFTIHCFARTPPW